MWRSADADLRRADAVSDVVAIAKGSGAGRRRRLAAAAATLILVLALFKSVEAVPQGAAAKPPPTLQDTGLYSDFATLQVDPKHLAFSPQRGKRGAYPLAGGRSHTIPGISDCKVCHQGGRSEVLGFSALQLSPERDPGALHAELQPGAGIDLRYLVEKGLLVGL